MDKKNKYLIAVLLIAISLIAFGRVPGNDFIDYDDYEYITNNNHIKSGINPESITWAFTAVVASNWHPLTLLSHILDWSLFGAHASGHHLINLLLHTGNVLFLFFFLNRATKSLWPSAFAAALFALHPLRVESVAWAAERKDVLSMFFGLATLYAYTLYAEKHKISNYILCLILFALGLLAKPMLVTLPFVLLLLDYWPLQRFQNTLKPAKMPDSVNSTSVQKKDKKRKADAAIKKRTSSPIKRSGQILHNLPWEKAPFF
ncbi:MAG: glycosyltransferase family 39 protein, partial [Proteobacteria bacterium]|nr:glycosyltransferase family 39 protein [Pseudomonadota bacterium]